MLEYPYTYFMKINWKEKACHIELENEEIILITSPSPQEKNYFLQVETDEYGNITFTKRERKST
jgi:hypothetical protein